MIQHITLPVHPDALPRCLHFYTLLGLRQVPPPPSLGDRAAWLEDPERAGVQLHLLLDEAAEARSGHLALVVPDLAATVTALGRLGHPFRPRREHWGAQRGYVRDPAGHLVELMEAPPPRHASGAE